MGKRRGGGHDCVPALLASRRTILKVAASMAVVSTASSARASPGAPFRFGLTPVCLMSDLDLTEGIRSCLSAMMGRDVELVTRRTYEEITALLISGQLDAAWICGYPFVAHRAQLELVAVPIWRGRPLYQSYLIVPQDRRGCAAIEDLESDIHAFSDPDSNSGYLVTAALLAARGRRPAEFFRRSFFTYAHRDVVRAVASRLADSGSVDGYVWEVMTETEPELTSMTRVAWRSGRLGFPPVAAAASKATGEGVKALRAALVGMRDDPLGRSVLDLLRLDGFSVEDPSLFDAIAAEQDAVRRLG